MLNDLSKLSGRTRIVVGNGFDIQCGLHTNYSNYFCYNWDKYRKILSAIYNYSCGDDRIIESEEFDAYNIWDFFFAVHGSYDPRSTEKKWSEVEKCIQASLIFKNDTSFPDALKRLSYIHWPDLKRYINYQAMPTDKIEKILVTLIKKRMKLKKYNSSKYYDFLLEQLKEFEISFGNFVYEQMDDLISPNLAYLRNVKWLLNELYPNATSICVDSFNYSPFNKLLRREVTLNHINGTYISPIFGIDSIFVPSNERFIFTKTSRRIESELDYSNFEAEEPFKNVVVYGHSLDEADYNYYFPIFDKLKLVDNNENGKLVFAYSIYKCTAKNCSLSVYNQNSKSWCFARR